MDKCPHCGSPEYTKRPSKARKQFDCGTEIIHFQDGRVVRTTTCRLNEAIAICRRHDSPAVNVGAHALAGKILAVLTGEERA